MNDYVSQFFSQSKNFNEVIALHEDSKMTWEQVTEKVEDFPRGWFELAHLSPRDRIDFTYEYWMAKIPFQPHLHSSLARFFKSLDDIGIYITQQTYDDPYEVIMIYSIKDNGGFYRGAGPASYDDCLNLQAQFPEHIFPEDYFAFLQIHNGFRKATDSTGIIPTTEVKDVYDRLQALIGPEEMVLTRLGKPINPKMLIPFYESFGMPFFQCFWEEWHHEQGMGNVYYSDTEKKISDPDEAEAENGGENLAFPTFSDWLFFYLERVE